MKRLWPSVLAALGLGCSMASPPGFSELDSAAADGPGTGVPAVDASGFDGTTADGGDAGMDGGTPPVDIAVDDIQPLDTPPATVDVGMDLSPLPDIPADTGPHAVDHCDLTHVWPLTGSERLA